MRELFALPYISVDIHGLGEIKVRGCLCTVYIFLHIYSMLNRELKGMVGVLFMSFFIWMHCVVLVFNGFGVFVLCLCLCLSWSFW